MKTGEKGLVVCKQALFENQNVPTWPQSDPRFDQPDSYTQGYREHRVDEGDFASMKTLTSQSPAVEAISDGHRLRWSKQLTLRGRARTYEEQACVANSAQSYEWAVEGRKLCAIHWGTGGIGSNAWQDANVVFLFDEFFIPRSVAVATTSKTLSGTKGDPYRLVCG